jgi:hypothetical protein
MFMLGGTPSVKIVLRNPLDKNDIIDYTIAVSDTPMGIRWYTALQDLLRQHKYLEKNFCFLGFPDSARDLEYICKELNWAKNTINNFFGHEYQILEEYTPLTMRDGLDPNQELMNQLHNHFEHLQGTVWGLSDYYKRADYSTKFAIRQLNNLCHEAESLMLSQRKQVQAPEWVRPSQITTFLNAQRFDFPEEFKTTYHDNSYDRIFGGVYLHWSQIGKTLFEVYRDEQGIDIDKATCDAITHLRYYSGEFDIEWAQDVIYGGRHHWYNDEMSGFKNWLERNGFNPNDTQYNFGHHLVGQVLLQESFGTSDFKKIWPLLSSHLDIYQISAGDVSCTYEYNWTDADYYQQQIERLKPGYDYSSTININ